MEQLIVFGLLLILGEFGGNCYAAQTSCQKDSDDSNRTGNKQKCIKFSTTFESFFPLVDGEYWIKSRREQSFQENISLSMYRYYMAQHLYARLVQIRAAKGLATRDEQRFAAHVQSVAPSVPYGVFTYLNAIGDIEYRENDTITQFFEYHTLAWPNQEGHFGPATAKNHWKYMSFPAPAVVAQAIKEDVGRRENNRDSMWNFYDGLPHGQNLGTLPTANLLGWKPAIELTLLQRQKLMICGINNGEFESINSQFFFNPKLMAVVHEYFQACPQATLNIKSWYKKNPHNIGTMEQLAWLEREVESDAPISKSFSYIEKPVMGFVHPLQANTEYLNKLSLIMGFRVKKYIAEICDWAVYDWNAGDYRKIPEQWLDTRNTVFNFGDIGITNGIGIRFSNERDGIRMEFLERCYKGQPMYQ